MPDAIVHLTLFLSGAGLGLGIANRIYVAKSKLYMNQIDSALDSIGIKRSEHLHLAADVTSIAIRVRNLEQAFSQLRSPSQPK